MKRCPTCNSTFDDEYLSYCTADGTVLIRDKTSDGLELQETVRFGEAPPTVVMPPPRPTAPQSPNAPTPPAPYGWANESPPAWAPPVKPAWVPPPPPVPFGGIRRPQQQGLAVASLILGIISITFGWICGGPIVGLVAVVLGSVALTQIKKNPQQYTGKPIAIAGVITGGIALLVNLAFMVFWILMMIIGAASN
jgi:Domain of unknown function (DUF4190)